MDGKISLTQELIAQARDYVPLAEKEAWVAENAPRCFDRLAITADGESQPPMYMVNTGLKSRYLMGAFVKLYLLQEFDAEGADNPALMSTEDYDRWAGSHVFNQLERLKHDAAIRNKAYDINADYKDLEKRFSAQISSLLAVQNDSVIRQNEISANIVKELPALLDQFKALEKRKGE